MKSHKQKNKLTQEDCFFPDHSRRQNRPPLKEGLLSRSEDCGNLRKILKERALRHLHRHDDMEVIRCRFRTKCYCFHSLCKLKSNAVCCNSFERLFNIPIVHCNSNLRTIVLARDFLVCIAKIRFLRSNRKNSRSSFHKDASCFFINHEGSAFKSIYELIFIYLKTCSLFFRNNTLIIRELTVKK